MKWENWYDTGLPEALGWSDAFIAVVTQYYDSSSWMAAEFQRAYTASKERIEYRLFVYNPQEIKLPLGFKVFVERSSILPADPSEAVKALSSL